MVAARLLFMVAAPFYVSPAVFGGFQFLHVLTNTFYHSSFFIWALIVVSVTWYLIVVRVGFELWSVYPRSCALSPTVATPE